MGNLGFPEIVLIVIIALVVFGPKKLPELSRTLGKALAEFRKASSDLRMAMEDEMRELERHSRDLERKTQDALTPDTGTPPVYDPDMAAGSITPPAISSPVNSAETQAPLAPASSSTEVKPPDGDAKPA
jgi:TatA/E family protein of Tat protein translocase